jgi:hypothetical protein
VSKTKGDISSGLSQRTDIPATAPEGLFGTLSR